MTPLRILLPTLALAGLAAACGKVGPPQPPADREITYPRPYPPPDSVVPPSSNAERQDGDAQGGDTQGDQQ